MGGEYGITTGRRHRFLFFLRVIYMHSLLIQFQEKKAVWQPDPAVMDRYEVLGYLPGVAPFETMLVRKKGGARGSGAQYVLQRAKLEGLPEAQQRCVINAATVLQQLANGCPHQVLVAESFMDSSGYACSVLEHCEVGPASLLLEAVRKQKEPLSESQVLSWTNDIALAIHHLHGIGLLHLNVGVNAVHICADGQAKLGDFAIACQLPDGASESCLRRGGASRAGHHWSDKPVNV